MITWLGVNVLDPFAVYWDRDNPLAPLLVLPGLLYTVALLAPALYLGARARSTLRKVSRAGMAASASGATGATVAAAVLANQGAAKVVVVASDQPPSNYFEPQLRRLRLTSPVYHGRSLFAIGIAAFEAGRAGAPRSWICDPLVLALYLARDAACLLVLAAFVASYYKLILIGATAFSGIAVSALILLPIGESSARRARRALSESGLLTSDELDVVREVMGVAPWMHFVPLLPIKARLSIETKDRAGPA